MIAPSSVELLVEEPSAEVALQVLVPKIVPGTPFRIQQLHNKDSLLKKLPQWLRGYAAWVPSAGVKIVVLVDRDDDDCKVLKQKLDGFSEASGLGKSTLLNRIVIEELEAWFFGDGSAIRKAYPRVPDSLSAQAAYRDPDAISGGTWEALERVLQKHGYHRGGLRKLAAAADIAPHMDVENNRSQSFQVFRDGLRRLVSEED